MDQWVRRDAIQPQSQRQSRLSDDQRARVLRLPAVLWEVYPIKVDQWMEGFERDLHPETEIRVWEAIVDAFHSYCSTHTLSLEGRKDVLRLLLLRGRTTDETEILRRIRLKELTPAQASEVMRAFRGEPTPILVQKQSR